MAQYLFDLVSVDLVVSLNGNSPRRNKENGELLSSQRLCQVYCKVPFYYNHNYSIFIICILLNSHGKTVAGFMNLRAISTSLNSYRDR